MRSPRPSDAGLLPATREGRGGTIAGIHDQKGPSPLGRVETPSDASGRTTATTEEREGEAPMLGSATKENEGCGEESQLTVDIP